MDQKKYYLVTGGPILAAWKYHQIECKTAAEQLFALAKELGASGAYGNSNGGSPTAFTFKGKPPVGWVKAKNSDGYKPGKKLPEMAARMQDIKRPGPESLYSLVTGSQPAMVVRGRYLHFESVEFEKIGDATVLVFNGLPQEAEGLEDCQSDTWKPCLEDPHLKPLKLSEYWTLREQQQKEAAKPSPEIHP